MTLTEATELVAILQISWPNHPWHEKADVAYHMGLSDLDYADVMAVIPELIRNQKFAPVSVEIRRLVLADRLESIPTAAEAWEEVSKQIRECGTRREYFFTHPLIDRIVKALGWYLLVNSERPHQDRKDFIAMYTEFRDKQLRETMLHPDGPKAIRVVGGADVLGLPV